MSSGAPWLPVDILLAFLVGLKAVRYNSDRFLCHFDEWPCRLLAWTLLYISMSLSSEKKTKGVFMTTPLYK